VDEGKQFNVKSFNVLGLPASIEEELLKDYPIGRIYNSRIFELFLIKHSSLFAFSPDDAWHVQRQLDERAGTVAITLDARPCHVD